MMRWDTKPVSRIMQMVGHDNVAPDAKVIGLIPSSSQDEMGCGIGQQRTSVLCTDRYEINERFVLLNYTGKMNRTFAVGQVIWVHQDGFDFLGFL